MKLIIAAFAACLASSCTGIRTFESTAEVHGGYDGLGDADQIYLELRNREGQASGGYALQLAPDWSVRDRRPQENGTYGLSEPLELGLVPIEQADPPARMLSFAGEAVGTSMPSDVPLLVSTRPIPLPEDPFVEAVATRLGVGASAYLLVDTGEGEEFRYDLYGAVGPPVEWVQLGRLDYPDSRGLASKSADLVVRGGGYLIEGAFFAAALTSPLWIWFVL